MTSPPAPRPQRLGELGEERVGRDAEAQQRQAQHEITVEHDVVLPQGVAHHLGCVHVVDPVDLEDDAEARPSGVGSQRSAARSSSLRMRE
jgi:hypothetical protein